MNFAGRLRKKLNDSINRICTKHSSFFVSPDKDFTRKGKFKPQDIFMSLLSMQGSSFVYTAPTATAARSICHALPLTAHGHCPAKYDILDMARQ